jgi:hypothetical protein
MKNGIIEFDRPEQCYVRKFVRLMQAKQFSESGNFKPIDFEYEELIKQIGMEDDIL